MAQTYGPVYAEIWRQALSLPGHDDLLMSLAAEFAVKFGGSPEEAARELEECWNRRWDVLGSAFRKSGSAEEVTSYYEEADHGIAISLYWHSLRPDRYALHSVAGLNTVQEFSEGRRVFEFGHGVGSTGILFARHGFEVVLGDVSKPYREFAGRRFAERDLVAKFVDLMVEEPQPDSFDAIVSFDVLEHLPDPLAAVKRMRRWLKPGGLLVMNVAFGVSAENPEHLLARRRGFVNRIRPLGFERIPSPTLLVFYKADTGKTFRMAYQAADFVEAVASDLLVAVPRLGRLIRPTRLPSL
jgi:SAM-dependent methyltransferase